MHTLNRLVQPSCIRCAPLVHSPKSRRGGYSASGGFVVLRDDWWRLSPAGDLAHGVMEAQAVDLDEEVNGVAGPVACGPTPIAVFDDQAGISRRAKLANLHYHGANDRAQQHKLR